MRRAPESQPVLPWSRRVRGRARDRHRRTGELRAGDRVGRAEVVGIDGLHIPGVDHPEDRLPVRGRRIDIYEATLAFQKIGDRHQFVSLVPEA